MKPMLATTFEPGSKLYDEVRRNPQDWAIEPKLDGMRALMHISDGQIHEFVSRTGKSVKEKIPYIVAAIQNRIGYWPSGWYDMELGVPVDTTGELDRVDFNKTMQVLGSKPNEAIRKQHEGFNIRAYVFDYYNAYMARVAWAERYIEVRSACHNTHSDNVIYTKAVLGLTNFEYHEDWFNRFVREGGEGAMLKHVNGLYVPGSRSKGWLKWKKYETIDAYVVGYEEGQGKYEGMVGALYFAETPNGESIGKCSGMTDAEREEWTEIFSTRIDLRGSYPAEERLIEVKHYGKLVDGLRHPQYSKWKRPE